MTSNPKKYQDINMMSQSERMLKVHRRNQLQTTRLNKNLDDLDRECKKKLFRLKHDIRDIYLYEQLPREREILDMFLDEQDENIDLKELIEFTDKHLVKPEVTQGGKTLKLPKIETQRRFSYLSSARTKYRSLLEYESDFNSGNLQRNDSFVSRSGSPIKPMKQVHPLVTETTREQLVQECRDKNFTPELEDFYVKIDRFITQKRRNNDKISRSVDFTPVNVEIAGINGE